MKAQKTKNKKIVLFVDDDLKKAKENEPITVKKLKDLAEKVNEGKRKTYNILIKTKELSDKYGFELKIFIDEKSTEDFLEKEENRKKIVMAIVDLYLPEDANKTGDPGGPDFGYATIEKILDLPHNNLKVIGILTIAEVIRTDIEAKTAQKSIKGYIHLLKTLSLKELEKRLEKGFREAAKGTRNRCCAFSSGDHIICEREYSVRKERSVFFMYPDNAIISHAITELERNKEKYFKKDLDDLEFIDWKRTTASTNSNLSCEICDGIEGTSLAIALKDNDCNANVMFEIGFAEGLGKKIKVVRLKDTEKELCPFEAGIEDNLEISMRDLDSGKSTATTLAEQLAGVINALPEEDNADIIDEPKEIPTNRLLIVSTSGDYKESDCEMIGNILRKQKSTAITPKCKSILPTDLSKIKDIMEEILQYNPILFCVHENPEVDNAVIYEYIGFAVARSRNVSVIMMDESMKKPSDVEKIAFTIQDIKPRGSLHETFVNKVMKDWHCYENN